MSDPQSSPPPRVQGAGTLALPGDGPPDFTLELRDLGEEPASHRARSLFGPWRRYSAVITDGLIPLLAEGRGFTPADAIRRAAAHLAEVSP